MLRQATTDLNSLKSFPMGEILANRTVSETKCSHDNHKASLNYIAKEFAVLEIREKQDEDGIVSEISVEIDVTVRDVDVHVGLVYDDKMQLHRHRTRHVECPERLENTWNLLKDSGIVERCERILSRPATKEELLLVHTAKYIENLSNGVLPKKEVLADNLYWSRYLNESALISAGSVVSLVESVIKGDIDCGFALVRPPGHHATANTPMGFCYYNNIAVAVANAMNSHKHLKRVLILDWDVHHGNGVQDIFYTNPNVMYISIHRWENEFYYPGTGGVAEIGSGNGRGYNINIPIMTPNFNDVDCVAIFEVLIEPLVKEFDPQLICICAGFDAMANDLVGDCNLTPGLFGHLTNKMISLSKGKLALALEGGYNIDLLGEAILSCMKALLGDTLPALKFSSPPNYKLERLLTWVSYQIQEKWSFFSKSFVRMQLEKFYIKYSIPLLTCKKEESEKFEDIVDEVTKLSLHNYY